MSYLNTAHKLNLRMLAEADEEARVQNAEALKLFYRGQHAGMIEEYIDEKFEDTDLAETYKSFKKQWNIIRKITNEVTVIGREDIEVSWQNEPDGEKWKTFEERRQFPIAMRTFFRYAELLRTVLINVHWDAKAQLPLVRMLTPDIVEVYFEKDNVDCTAPDRYVLNTNQIDGIYEIWDVKNRQMWREDADGDIVGEIEEFGDEYGDDPFIAIRADYPVGEFWYDDDVETLISLQKSINHILCQLAVAVHFGNQFPIVEGSQQVATTDHLGNAIAMESFRLDCSMVTFTGVNDNGEPRSLRFDGPDVQRVIDAIFRVLEADIGHIEESKGFSRGAFQIEQAESGIAIKLRHAPLQDKFDTDSKLHTPIVRRIIEQVRGVWDKFDPTNAPSGEFDLKIPAPEFAAVKAEEIEDAKKQLSLGLIRPFEVLRLLHPDLKTDEDVEKYLEKTAEDWEILRPILDAMKTNVPRAPQLTGGIFEEAEDEGDEDESGR